MMDESRSSDGFLPIKEGSLYWRLDFAEDGEESTRPTVLLVHAGVADHTMWDTQVEYLVKKGWNCLRVDLFGYGRSYPNDIYLRSEPREPFDAIEHLDLLRRNVLSDEAEVIIVGLSIGGSMGLGYTIACPESVKGLAIIAGGLRGFEFNNDPQEDMLFDKAESLIKDGDVQGAANMMVRIWGDGPLQEPGRLAEDVADRMLRWNIDISARECARTGGFALDPVRRDPPPTALLHTINCPTAIAYGTFDETFTNAAMKHVSEKVRGATLKEFKTAHMVNLEHAQQLNQWLGDWLDAYFPM